MENFTPLSATVGGLLIGLATTILWVANGRTAGMSNIAGDMVPIRRGGEAWRIVFLLGLPAGAWLGQPMNIDRQLAAGSAIFGIGWGLSGFCPGPAVADLGLVAGDVWLFVVAMLIGSWGAGQVMEWSSPLGTKDAGAGQAS